MKHQTQGLNFCVNFFYLRAMLFVGSMETFLKVCYTDHPQDAEQSARCLNHVCGKKSRIVRDSLVHFFLNGDKFREPFIRCFCAIFYFKSFGSISVVVSGVFEFIFFVGRNTG